MLFNRYKKKVLSKYITGCNVAKAIQQHNKLNATIKLAIPDIDNYDLKKRWINLSSESFFYGNAYSIAAAAHECGHAIQHKNHYWPLKTYWRMLPIARDLSVLPFILLALGVFNSAFLFAGGVTYLLLMLFFLLFLPIEFNASSLAIKNLRELDLVTKQDMPVIKEVLFIASLLYFVRFLAAPVLYPVIALQKATKSK